MAEFCKDCAEKHLGMSKKELCYVVKSIDGKPILGRDKQKRQSRTFTQEAQARAWLRRNGYRAV